MSRVKPPNAAIESSLSRKGPVTNAHLSVNARPYSPREGIRNPQAGEKYVFEGLAQASIAYLAAIASSPVSLVCVDEDRAQALYDDLVTWLGPDQVALFQAETKTPYDALAPDPRLALERLAWRQRVLAGRRPQVTVVTAAALQGTWMPEADFQDLTRKLCVGEDIDRDDLSRELIMLGYQQVALVEDPGTYAVRGGIIDIFVPGERMPWRLDLFGDELSSIRKFAPESQKLFEKTAVLLLFPIRDALFADAMKARCFAALDSQVKRDVRRREAAHVMREQVSAGHYFFGIEAIWPLFFEHTEPVASTILAAETLTFLDDADAVRDFLKTRDARARAEYAQRLDEGVIGVGPKAHLATEEMLESLLGQTGRIETTILALDPKVRRARHAMSDVRKVALALKELREDVDATDLLSPLIALLRGAAKRDEQVLLTVRTNAQRLRLRGMLEARGVDVPDFAEGTYLLTVLARATPRISLGIAALSSGFVDQARALTVLTEGELFGAPKKTRVPRAAPKSAQSLTTLKDLRPGDLVIHKEHGIGRYHGLTRLFLGGVDGDFAHLEYAGQDKLYLPVIRLGLLQRFRGPADHARLDKLGSGRWEKQKARVREDVLAVAHGLLQIEGRRRGKIGFSLPAPDAQYTAFAETFVHHETIDQQRAIDEVLSDLQKTTPMDRLICGDVGFGKTEVALRAAFLAAYGGKQVAVLVPTTVLAEQHYQHFLERLTPFGINVSVLSRFATTVQIRAVERGLADKTIDVVVGTHKLLSTRYHFSDLGLLIVDEEQRFGVTHKERIKAMRAHVHVLAMSATPIPRTLHMATVGLRDLSLITTPPAERSDIRTEILRFDEDAIREALTRELHRGGQSFFVHNRVTSIEPMAAMVRRLVPEARVAVAHGQLSAHELEHIMVNFVQRNYDVLVSTAIIESGIDIPSANTMIVNRADRFGLSQLYQLRGRIGRGRARGHAYLMVPAEELLTREAMSRLALLKRFSQLGAGFQIASHDLDLRGAGDLLGADQSGNIAAVGFELYTELLQEAVERARGQPEQPHVEPDIKLPIAAVLPEAYIPDALQRLAYYQRLTAAADSEESGQITEELTQIYGPLPEEALCLLDLMGVRRQLCALGATSLSVAQDSQALRLGLTFLPEAHVDRQELVLRCQKEPDRYRILASGRLAIAHPAPVTLEPRALVEEVYKVVLALPLIPVRSKR